MKKLTLLFLFIAAQVFAQTKCDEEILENTLGYLSNIKEVRMVEFDNHNVYIHLRELPADWREICTSAALTGNKTIDFGVSIWAVVGAKYPDGWRGGDECKIWKCITARYGKIEH